MKEPNLVLSGFMASGKTTVGRSLAGMLGRRFVDTDSVVESGAGMEISEIFRVRGEGEFRELERKAIAAAVKSGGAVIAVGGGAVTDRKNLKMLRKSGVIYHLDVTAAEALARARGGGSRPLLGRNESEVEELLAARRGCYRAAADRIVETTGRDPSSVAREIAADFRTRARERKG